MYEKWKQVFGAQEAVYVQWGDKGTSATGNTLFPWITKHLPIKRKVDPTQAKILFQVGLFISSYLTPY